MIELTRKIKIVPLASTDELKTDKKYDVIGTEWRKSFKDPKKLVYNFLVVDESQKVRMVYMDQCQVTDIDGEPAKMPEGPPKRIKKES